jgi:hypothetical protein
MKMIGVKGWVADIDRLGQVIVEYGTFRKIGVHKYTFLNPDMDKFGTLLQYRPRLPHVYNAVYQTMDEAMDALSKVYSTLIVQATNDIAGWSIKLSDIRKAQGEINASENS